MRWSRVYLYGYLPALVWMVVIFSASSDKASFQHSSRIIGPLVHWFFPNATEHTIRLIILLARKGAHLTEYAILSTLILRALQVQTSGRRLWQARHARIALLLVALYAATDEFHQTFVASRQGSVWDVLIDTSGAAIGLCVVWIVSRFVQRQEPAAVPQ